jgi:hypothetical protein
LYGSGVDRVEQLRWALFVDLLTNSATRDLDHEANELNVVGRRLNARTHADAVLIEKQVLNDARMALNRARKQQQQLRRVLLLDDPDEEPDGQS